MAIEIESVDNRLEEIAKKISEAIIFRDWKRFVELMVEFAEEVKREAIEP